MEKCYRCCADTELFIVSIPTCVQCAGETGTRPQDSIDGNAAPESIDVELNLRYKVAASQRGR
jgi:hypothetical protein